MKGQNSKDKYRKNKEASIKLQIEITEKEAKRIALTYATISLGAFGIGGFLTYLGCVGGVCRYLYNKGIWYPLLSLCYVYMVNNILSNKLRFS